MNQTLEAFKMNKTQMNRIGGGKKEVYKCEISAHEWGGTTVYEDFTAESETDAYNQAYYIYNAQSGSNYFIDCRFSTD